MASNKFAQLRRFSTDAFGLERTFRFFQALTQILIPLVATPTSSKSHLVAPLAQLQGHLNITRRSIRLFRFFDCFHAAYAVVVSGNPALATDAYLDVLSNTFNGLYFLLEAATFVDAMKIDGLTVWESDQGAMIRFEAQRCWFLSLVFGAIASGLRFSMTRRELAVHSARQPGSEAKTDGTTKKKSDDAGEQRTWQEKKAALEKEARRHVRKLVVNVLDIPLPGSAIGWVHAEPRTLGLAMMLTSVLTGYDVWERCGKGS